MAEFIDDELPKIDVEITEGDDLPTPTPRDRGNNDKGDDKGDKDKGDKDKGDKDKGDKDDKDDKDDKGDKDDKDKKNKDKDKDKEKDKDKNKDKQHPLVGTLFYFENDSTPKWLNKDYQIHEIVQNPDGSLAYTYFKKNKKKYLVSITEQRYYDMLDAEQIFQFQFKIGSKWITDKEDYIYTIHSLFEDLKINYVRYNVESGERSMEDEYVRGLFYKDSEGNELNFAEWFDLQILLQEYKPFEEKQEEDEEEQEEKEQEEKFPLSYGSMYVLANQNGAYRTNPNAYFFMKVLSTDFSEDYFTVRSYNEKGFSDVNVDKGDFLTAYANDEVKIYPFKEEDKISTCDDNGIPDFEKVFELDEISMKDEKTQFLITLTTESATYKNNLVITETPYEIGGINFNFIDYIDARILSGSLVVISKDERKDDDEEEEQPKRDIMKPPYLQSVNFYYELRNTDKSVMRVLLGKNYTAFAELLNESEKKDAEGDAKEGWYWMEYTWQSFNIGQRQQIIELDEKLLKAMFLIVKNNLEKFANDYYFTNFIYDRLGYLFKDMIINGLSYKYSNAMVEENNLDVILFEIFPINEEEFLLYIYNQPLDDKWVSHVRYKESQKEIIITSLLKGASELTDLLLIEKVENYQQSGVIVRKTYFDDENNTQKFFENSTIFKMMQNYVTTISSGFF